MAQLRRAYDSDITDARWQKVRTLVPEGKHTTRKGGRPPQIEKREILNAILYIARTGCQWRLSPHDFPNWKTVYDYFVVWHACGVFECMNTLLREEVRISMGRSAQPTAGVIDSQSVKIVANIGYSGFDGGKKVNGRKRHIVTDTLGLLLTVVVHEASLQDRAGAKLVFEKLSKLFTMLSCIFADQGYTAYST